MSAHRPKIDKADYYRGIRMTPYDLVKEIAIATVGILVVVLILSAVLSSPDVPSATIQRGGKITKSQFAVPGVSLGEVSTVKIDGSG